MSGLIQSDIVIFHDGGVDKGARADFAGGLYIWENDSSNFNGATISLKTLGADASTYKTIATATTNAAQSFYIAAGSTVDVTISGSPTALYSRLMRVPL